LSSLGYAIAFAAMMLCFPVLGFVISRLLPSRWSLNLFVGLPLVVLLGLIAWVPALVFLRQSEEVYPDLALLVRTSSMIIIATTIMTAIWSAYKADRLEYIAEIEQLNTELSRLNSLHSQASWVTRRAWTHLMHGDVQSALTIALARLRASPEIDDATLEMVAGDIERARLALVTGVPGTMNWRETFAEIEATWSGVCDLSCETSAGAERLFDANQTAAVCAAEIIKELVSNAYRHGEAREVRVRFSLDANHDLKVAATNDGKPVPSDLSSGVGLGMITELTNGWAFRNSGRRVHFEALVPVAAGS
jgi:signal transduction histidine kinase